MNNCKRLTIMLLDTTNGMLCSSLLDGDLKDRTDAIAARLNVSYGIVMIEASTD